MGTEVQIRKATQGDLDRVVELYDAICDYLDATFNYPGWTRGESPARWTAEQALANGELYVCADGEALLGTCILNGVQPEGYQDIPWQEPGCLRWPAARRKCRRRSGSSSTSWCRIRIRG